MPLGYDVKDRKLVVNKAEAATVRMIFQRFIKIGSATELVHSLRREGTCGKQGKLVDKGYVYKLLNNRVYVGEAVYKGTAYPGEHQAIVDRGLWDRVHAILRESPRKRGAHTRAQTPALLKGLIFGPTGRAMTPAHTRKGDRLYRYYVSTDVLKRDAEACTVRRIPAAEIESAVVDQLRGLPRSPVLPEVAAEPAEAFRAMGIEATSEKIRDELQRLAQELFKNAITFDAPVVKILYKNVAPENIRDNRFLEALKSIMPKRRVPQPIIESLFESGQAAPETGAFLGR